MWQTIVVLGIITNCAAFLKVDPEPISPADAASAVENAEILRIFFSYLLILVPMLAVMACIAAVANHVGARARIRMMAVAIVPAIESRD